ncbi:MAG TPA: hypothetical protein VE046_09090 [Steroidobacteraceae bacterium]|nr:hypothetical protein [Steroidobacteraceae bacterium]
MSIVERALGKLQSGASGTGDSRTRETNPHAVAPAPAAPHEGVAAPFARRGRIEPKESIHVNLEHLRAQGMLPPHELASFLADEFRRIKWPLIARAREKGADVAMRGSIIMVTSSVPDEGKSYVALNLALSIAVERDCRVLLIDTDSAKARVSRIFGLQSHLGLTDCLKNERAALGEFIVATDIVGLSLLPAGRPDPSTPELFASRRMESLLNELASEDPNAVLLLDCSPLLAKNEAQVLARLVDHTLMIVRADRTPQPVVHDALALLDHSRPISVVLNQVAPDWLGKYRGHYGYDHDAS